MGRMKDIDIEIKNSPALSFLWHEIQGLQEKVDELEKREYKPVLNFLWQKIRELESEKK